MKKLFTLLAFVWFFTHTAASFNVPVIIDDVSRVLVSIEGTPVEGLKNGLNEVPYTSGYILFKAAPGCKLVSVIEREEGWDDYERTIYNDECELRPYEGVTYVVATAGASDVRSATAQVWVDTPSKVILLRGEGEERVELAAGDNEVAFDPASEKRFSISPADSDHPLYKVNHNGRDVAADGVVRLDMADGDNLRIQAEYPDEKYRVRVVVAGDYADDRFVQGLYADGIYVSLAGAGAEGVEVSAGARLTLSADTRSWEVLSFTVNGVSDYFSESWSTLVKGDIELCFNVRKYATLRVSVSLDAPAHVKVYSGLHYNGELVEIPADGNAVIDVRRSTPVVTFVPDEDYHFTAVTVDDYMYDEADIKTRYMQVGSLEEGETITVRTAAYRRDRPATVIVNGGTDNFSLTRSDGSVITVAPGRNDILFDPWDNPFTFDCRGPEEPYLYVNGRETEPTFPSSRVYSVSLDEGDVAEVYFGERPAGIAGLEADSAAAGTVLYNLQGMRVTTADPPAGLYVRSDGTKVLID